MLNRVAKAIELAKGNVPYYVFPQFKNKYMVYKILDPGFVDQAMASKMLNLEEAENLCEKLNNEYIARKAVEALKEWDEEIIDGPGIDTLDLGKSEWMFVGKHRCAQIWQELISNIISK